MLRTCALNQKWCKQRIQNDVDSVLLSDLNVSYVLYNVIKCLFGFIFCLVSHSSYFESFTIFAKVLCKKVVLTYLKCINKTELNGSGVCLIVHRFTIHISIHNLKKVWQAWWQWWDTFLLVVAPASVGQDLPARVVWHGLVQPSTFTLCEFTAFSLNCLSSGKTLL